MNIRIMTGAAALAGAGLITANADATVIQLSTHSSNGTLAEHMDASLDFQVAGNLLTLTVTNETGIGGDPAFNINEVYFNGTDNVIALTPVGLPTGWSFQTSQAANGFGVFDFALIDGQGNDPDMIQPGESLVFNFTITGIADMNDFVDLSSIPPGSEQMYAAAKFVNGPGDDSAFGASNVIPAPGAVALLGLAGLAAHRRRRRA